LFTKKVALIAALGVFAVTACNKDNEAKATDTTLVTGADTVNAKAVVPTTDTVVRTATITTDTLKGSASSSTTPKIVKKK
jgi:hypothetical protein